MSRQSRRRSGFAASPSISAPSWIGAPCLELVREFNERLIEAVSEAAREGDRHRAPEMVRAHRDLWLNLDPATRQRASRFPFLLADIRFHDATWWQRARSECAWQDGPPGPTRLFVRRRAAELTRDALIVAWRTAQQDPRLAVILLAMSGEVARIVATLGLGHLRRIADLHPWHLRPRWDHSDLFWGRFLSAASRDDRRALRGLHMHALQLADSDSRSAASPTATSALVHD